MEVFISYDKVKIAVEDWAKRKVKLNKPFKHPVTEFIEESGLKYVNVRKGVCSFRVFDAVLYMRARLMYNI